MRFEIFHPCDALRAYVACFIISENEPALPYTVLPDTALVMGFQYKGQLALVSEHGARPLATAGITGLQQEHRRFLNSQFTGTVLVKFKPGGAASFFRLPLHELFGQSLSLDLLAPRSASIRVEEQLGEARSDTARIEVIEDFLLSCKVDQPEDKLAIAAVQLITQSGGAIRIAELAKQLYTSASPLEKRFRSRIGASPKKFAQIIRFQNLLASSGNVHSAAAKAYEGGYFDQAHFINDFRRFSGQTPQAFFAGKLR